MTQNRSDDTHPEMPSGRRRLRMLLGGLCAVALCVAIRYYWGADPASAQSPRRTPAKADAAVKTASRSPVEPSSNAPARSARGEPAAGTSVPPLVATVNTQRITREDLARDCLKHYGKEVLDSMINKHLIVRECQRQGVTVTRKDVDDEIGRMAQRFGIPVDKWLKMLKQERNITPTQYANDIIWPTLALRRLAGERLRVTDEEKIKEFETMYGEAVRARLIAVSDPQKAKKLQAQAAANPDDFGNLAKDYSEDAPSASAKGVIQPIRQHGTYKEIEDVVFRMADGAVSPVIHAGGQYVILKREGLLPAVQVTFEQVAPRIEEVLRERKMRSVAQDVFKELQKNAKVQNVLNDPAKRQKMPGVAAAIDGDQITVRELAEECIDRHGQEVLEGMINRRLLEQACQKRNLTVTDADIDQEIARAALAGVKPKDDGSPDVEAWLALVTKKQNIPLDIYRNDAVWPSAALKKLAGNEVKITEDDLQKGYEANYGTRVRCLAIVLNNERRAQQVFEMARTKNTTQYFGDLAAEYSVEPGSQALRGEVPPIKKFGGQPILEKEAFALKPGELSGVIPVGDKFVLLRCEGFTKTTGVDFAKVRDEIYQDIHEKKMRLAMAACFENLQDSATIDNYLAGTSRSPTLQPAKSAGMPSANAPARSATRAPAAGLPTLRQVPGG